LRNLSVLPNIGEQLNNEQKEINRQINNGTFIIPKKWSNINLKPNQKLTKEDLTIFENEYEIKHTNEYTLLKRAEINAKNRSLEFNLTIDDIIIPDKCPYFKIPFDNSRFSLSIDRIDSNKGYVKGNIQIISYLSNKMKNDVSIDELIIFSKNVLKLYSKD